MPDCPERAVRAERLEADLAKYLGRLEVGADFQHWVVTHLRQSHETNADTLLEVRKTQEKAYSACVTRLANLVRLKTAPENVDGSLLSDVEYARQRLDLLKAKDQL